jgi:hypothetical protein
LKRLFYAWELGSGLGHVNRFLALRKELLARGCDLTLTLGEPLPPGVLPDDLQAAVHPAPRYGKEVLGLPREHLAFSELMMHHGYLEPEALTGLLGAWRDLMRQARAQLVITDYGPTALLAARSLGLPCVRIGNGFCCPPAVDPEAPFMPSVPPPPARRDEATRLLLGNINDALEKLGAAPLSTLGRMHHADCDLLTTVGELDPYGRPAESCVGPIWDTGEGVQAQWPQGRAPRAFVYLKGLDSMTVPMLRALRRKHLACMVYCPGLPAAARAEFESSLMHFSERPLAVRQVIPDADLVVCGGTHNILCAALLAGKPVLAIPCVLEQVIHSDRVQAMGAGLALMPGQESRTGAVLTRLLTEKAFAQAAGAFAARYAGRSQADTIHEIAERCLRLAG